MQFQDALALYKQGRFDEADAACAGVLERDPKHFDALHLRGVIALHNKSHATAAEFLRGALAVSDMNAAARNNLGMAEQQLGNTAAALASYERAIALKPDFAAALSNRGNALRSLGRNDEALASCDAALSARPDYADAWYSRGLALRALARPHEAQISFAKAIALRPDYADAHNALGLVLEEAGQSEAALTQLDKAVALQPGLAEAWNNRGNALQSLRRMQDALASYDRSITLDAGNAQTWNNRGGALDALGRSDEALASYDHALALDSGLAGGWSNRGTLLATLGRRSDARASFERALAVDPHSADANWNLSLLDLQEGDFARGWARHEWRWKVPSLKLMNRDFGTPGWLGREPLAGKTILLHADQGFGDAIQFSRYAPLVAAKGARVILEVRAPLVRLLARLPDVAEVVKFHDPLPAFDFHCALASLPLAFGTDLTSIPAPGGYLQADTAETARRRVALGEAKRPRVGLAWSGNPHHANDRRRSIGLTQLLATLPDGFDYVVLQKDLSAADRALAASRGIAVFGTELEDFADTAALCSALDLVISVDTSIAHLAGALGKPVWVLLPFNPDWRWMLGRTDSPWYTSAWLFRQHAPDDWSRVLDAVKAGLLSRRA